MRWFLGWSVVVLPVCTIIGFVRPAPGYAVMISFIAGWLGARVGDKWSE